MVIPSLFKEIRNAELDIPIEILPDFFYWILFLLHQVLNYEIFTPLLSLKGIRRLLSRWSFLGTTFLLLKLLWKSQKISFIDGYTRNVHYSVVQKSLFTRNRLAKFVPGMSEFCKLCVFPRETIFHVFLDCTRSQEAWSKLAPFWVRMTGKPLSQQNKIFGVLYESNKYFYWLLNAQIQVMQRSIWQTRKIHENKGIEHNLWKYFRWKFSVLINRAYLFWGDAFLEEISEDFPVELVNNAVRIHW